MDFSKTKPSKNLEDRTNILDMLLKPWATYDPDLTKRFSESELNRLVNDAQNGKYTDFREIFRERMRNEFLMNFFMEGGNRAHKNFNFHQEDFDTHSNLRSKNQEYDKY